MKHKVLIVLATLIGSSNLPASASDTPRFDGKALLQQCDSAEPLIAMSCWSFITGVLEGSLATSAAREEKPIICLPEVYSQRMIRDSVLAWIRLNEQYQPLSSGPLVTQAMRRQFPCNSD